MDFQQRLADKIVQRRKELDIEQEEVLDYAKVSAATLSGMERAKGNPTIKTILKVIDFLGLELEIKVKER